MLLIKKEGIQKALRRAPRTANRRVQGLPDAAWPHPHYNRYWHAAGVIGSLEEWERTYAPDILDHSIDDSILHCGNHEGALENSNRFIRWASEEKGTWARWNAIRAQFSRAFLNTPGCAAFAPYAESLTRRFCLVPGVTRFVVTGDKESLPAIGQMVPAFSLINSGFDSLTIVGGAEFSDEDVRAAL